MKLPGPARFLGPAAVAAAVGGAYALAAYTGPVVLGPGRPRWPAAAAVSTAVRTCPAPGTSAGAGVALIAAPATTGSGRAEVSSLAAASGTPLFTVTRPGQLSVQSVRVAPRPHGKAAVVSPGGAIPAVTTPGGVVIRASGSMARGLEAEQTGPGGVPSLRCASPGTDFWFVGPGQQSVARIDLYLMNPGNQPADVSVVISTDAGPLQGATDAGVSVPPHSMVVQSLAPALRGSHVVALHVLTSIGQVSAAVEEVTGSSGTGAWLPVAQAPSTRIVLPGLPGTGGTRDLLLAVPGDQNAQVRVTAITTRGSYQPTGGAGLDIPGGSAVDVALPSLAGIPAALEVTANVPVTATVMLSGGASSAPGVFTAASAPIEEQGVAADDPVAGGASAELVLSAPAHAARARISRAGSTGSAGASSIVSVPARASLVVPLPKAKGRGGSSPFAVVITPLAGSGPLYAGQVVQDSTTATVESVLPVASALTSVPLPGVRAGFVSLFP